MSLDIDTTNWTALTGMLRGSIHLPDEYGYDQARQVWNGMIDRRPAAVVSPTGVADVITTVRFASEQALPVAIRCGGHNVAGIAVGDGAVVIDMGRFKTVRVDPVQRAARAGGGILWCEYDHETQAFGLASPGGAISTTGIAGLTLGGGYGSLSRRYGMACDNLLSADVVTASGELVHASVSSHPDLFWALRGGGGNFGVVTALEYQLHPVRNPLGGFIAFPFEMSKIAFQLFRQLNLETSDDISVLAAIIPAPDGSRVVAVALCDFGTSGEGERAVQRLRKLGTAVIDTFARMPYCAMQQQFDVSYPKGQRHYWKSAFLKALPDELIDLIIEAALSSPSPLSAIMIEGYGGAVARVPDDATAFGHRDAMFNLGILAISTDPTIDETQKKWAREYFQRSVPYTTGRAYVNYMSEGEDVHTAYHDVRYQRLAAIKAQYDPANLFRFNHNISPAKA